ncbi:MAG: acylphosphatase [Candidatus Omnitrophota bacterium]
MEKSAIHIRITGFVQNVLFLIDIKKNAEELCLTGWIKKPQWDGSVEAFFEGNKDALSNFINWCDPSSFREKIDKIDKIESDWQNYTGKFDKISIL